MQFYENFALFHPIRALKIALRRRMIAWDHVGPDGSQKDIPTALQQFTEGEILPWKGVTFRVGRVFGGPFPAVVLVPTVPTHGAKLRTMKNFRAAAKFKVQREREIRAALNAEAK